MIARKMTISDNCRKSGSPNYLLIEMAQKEIAKEAAEILRNWPIGKGMRLSFILEIKRPESADG